jgi:hypothetical protein
LYVLADVSRLKEKVLRDLIAFRAKFSRTLDIEEGRGPEQTGRGGTSGGDFNAAKYLFLSWRLASLYPELLESRLIRQFRTPWPKRKFGDQERTVSSVYEQAVILTALSRILLFFLGSLLRFHTLVQDILLQTICNSGLGFLIVTMIRLFAIHPALPVAVSVALLLLLGWLLRIGTGKRELSSITPRLLQDQDPPPPSQASSPPPDSPAGGDLPPPNEQPLRSQISGIDSSGSTGGSHDGLNLSLISPSASANVGVEECMWSDEESEGQVECMWEEDESSSPSGSIDRSHIDNISCDSGSS